MRKILFFLLVCLSWTTPALTKKKPASLLQGTEASMAAENRTVDRHKLPRIKNDTELKRLINEGILVSLQETACLEIDPKLPPERRFVRPATRVFLLKLSAQFCAKFENMKLRVSSAVRTLVFQKELIKTNLNAARGDRSTHLTGATSDITKIDLLPKHIAWLQKKLMQYEKEGKIHATEEHGSQIVFHIMVIP